MVELIPVAECIGKYNLNDHASRASAQVLGNTRVSFGGHSNGNPEIMQVTDYYPFGMIMAQQNFVGAENALQNKYLYNSKELQDDNLAGVKLDWYDYGARFYDPAIGRWHTPDPLAEGYYDLSPYSYCAGNPIACRDENGEWINFVVGAVLGGGVELVGQTIAQLATGTNLSDVNIDWVDVGAATVEGGLTSGGSTLRRVAVTAISAGVQAAFDDNNNIITGEKSLTQAGKEFAGNIATAGVGAGTQKVVNASTKEAVSSANKQVVKANNAVTTAENRLAKQSNSPKAQTQVNNAKANAQTARTNQVRTQMAHNTVGKTNIKKINVAQQTVNTGANATKNNIVDEKEQ